MIDFHNLNTPTAGFAGKWVILAQNDMFLVLLRTGELGYGPDYSPAAYQFDTEGEAHFAGAAYYNQNLGRTYPYFDRMQYVLKGGVNTDNKKINIHSQVMDFK